MVRVTRSKGRSPILPGSTDSRTDGDNVSIEIDPVCGMEVDTATAANTYEYEGKRYYFCGKGCRLEFEDDPQTFLDPDYEPSM